MTKAEALRVLERMRFLMLQCRELAERAASDDPTVNRDYLDAQAQILIEEYNLLSDRINAEMPKIKEQKSAGGSTLMIERF